MQRQQKRNPLIIKEARTRRYNENGYVVVKRAGIVRNKKDPKPPPPDKDKLKYADQNLGTHNKKGEFIKKRRFKMFSRNPETAGRNIY
jgi:hypothetical protein